MMVNILSNKHNKHYQKHLTLLNREDIEKLLKAGFKFYQIAENIQKDPTTISKEVKKYRTEHFPSNFNNKNNYCKNKRFCTIKNLCNSNCHSECSRCNTICSKFELDLCEKLLKPPYVLMLVIVIHNVEKSNMYTLLVMHKKAMRTHLFLLELELIFQKKNYKKLIK